MSEALASVAGAAVALLRADAGVLALVPAGHVYAGQEPQEVRLPYVVVEDEGGDSDWVTEQAALEKHKLKVPETFASQPYRYETNADGTFRISGESHGQVIEAGTAVTTAR